MKKNPAQLKLQAKQALKGNYSLCAVSLFVIGAIFCAAYAFIQIILIIAAVGMGMRQGGQTIVSGPMPEEAANVFLISFFAFSFLFFIISLASFLMSIGYVRLCYRICKGERGRIKDLFFSFGRHIGKYIALGIFYQLLPFVLGLSAGFINGISAYVHTAYGFVSIFFAIIMVVEVGLSLFLGLNYGMAILILIEEPEKSFFRALKESRRMMKGNRLRFFWLGLTFLGMVVLCYLSCGLGFIWITPYIACTVIFFYFDITGVKEIESDYGG